jgi:hypothetical protein
MANCNCNYNQSPLTSQCKSCNSSCSTGNCSSINSQATQKQIWHQIRVPASLYTMNFAALANTQRFTSTNNWNQSSDQLVESQQTAYHPTRGNSTKRTLTSSKPGSAAPGGKGVDIKYNSYARYLNRLKGGTLVQQTKTIVSTPLYGNKKQTFGLIPINNNCCK